MLNMPNKGQNNPKKGELINTDSFVSFYPKGHAHYQCMKEDDELQKKVLDSVEQQLKEEKKFDW